MNAMEDDKTSRKPQREGGPGKLRGANDGVPFTKDNQPTPRAKKLGWMKKKRGQELVKAVLELSFKGQANTALKRKASAYFGIEEKNITVEMILVFKQAEKAIQKSDTYAFNAIMDRAFGKPKEKTEITTKDGKDLFSDKSDDELKALLKQTIEKIESDYGT